MIDNKYIKYKYNFWKIDKLINKKIPDHLSLPDELKNLTWGKLFIEVIEKYVYIYPKLENWLNKYADNLIKDNYFELNVFNYLKSIGIDYNRNLDIEYGVENISTPIFKKIYRKSFRRSLE